MTTTTKKISAGKQRKINTVTELKEKLDRTKALFLTDYRGLTHQQIEQLKKALKKVEAEFVVVKNTLLRIALQGSSGKKEKPRMNGTTEKLTTGLKNPTAVLLAFGDEIAAIKTLANFIKTSQLPKIKVGLFAGKIAEETDFNKLAIIPGRDILLSLFAIRLKSPLSQLHYALNWNLQRLAVVLSNIKNKK
ncbi:50S ribosomal protein L10 [Candidatus Gottesmanbacteria bacterium]|nr:50S ribosomal protein L10 [Candidatus Gottesmanbacteria bacterium]